jgi:hypothetical protein
MIVSDGMFTYWSPVASRHPNPIVYRQLFFFVMFFFFFFSFFFFFQRRFGTSIQVRCRGVKFMEPESAAIPR